MRNQESRGMSPYLPDVKSQASKVSNVRSVLNQGNVKRFNEESKEQVVNPSVKSGNKSVAGSKMVSINVGQGK